MLQVARVRNRGLKSDGTGVERDHGKRTAIVTTPGGDVYCIGDPAYRKPYVGHGIVPALSKDRNGPSLPLHANHWVIIQTAGARAAHGTHPEPTFWMSGWKYWDALRQCLQRHTNTSSAGQTGVVKLVTDYLDDSFGPICREDWLSLQRREARLIKQGLAPEMLQFLKDYYLLS